MPRPAHTPYDGSSQPFSIGLKPMDPMDWIDVDEDIVAHLTEKERLLRDRHATVFRAEADTLEAQTEVLDLLWAHLPERYPEIYVVSGDTIDVRPTDTQYTRAVWHHRPLELASRLVQEDLVIMRASPQGHRLVAASLCFPSSWSLAEKFGHAMADIHAPVPNFQRGSRIATLIERIFSNLQPELPVERFNWSLYDAPRLHYPERSHADRPEMWVQETPETAPRAWIRAERQTLRRLPACRDILFTIKICVDPVSALMIHPDRATLATSFAEQLEALDTNQLAYKGLEDTRDAAIAWFRTTAEL